MRLEQVPLYIGVVVAILGVGLVLDARLPDRAVPSRERRRRARTERHRGGETMVGLGIVGMAAALIGRDTWRFGTVTVLVSAVLLGVGAWLNREYLRELLLYRGAARRGEKRSAPRGAAADAASVKNGARPSVTAPGLADTPAPRAPGGRITDREAPIMTASEGMPRRARGSGEDTPPEGGVRLR